MFSVYLTCNEIYEKVFPYHVYIIKSFQWNLKLPFLHKYLNVECKTLKEYHMCDDVEGTKQWIISK